MVQQKVIVGKRFLERQQKAALFLAVFLVLPLIQLRALGKRRAGHIAYDKFLV